MCLLHFLASCLSAHSERSDPKKTVRDVLFFVFGLVSVLVYRRTVPLIHPFNTSLTSLCIIVVGLLYIYIYIYIIYTPKLGLEITVSVREREQGRFRGSTEGARGRSKGAPREHGGASREHGGASGEH